MIVPTGRARAATSTSGPVAWRWISGMAWAAGVLVPVNMFFAISAVIVATTRAQIASMSFFTSMTPVASSAALSKQPHTSDKLLKKRNTKQTQAGERDRESVGYLQLPRGLAKQKHNQQRRREHTARHRHDEQQLH